MPLGGGDVGLNVWVENGELLFYVSQSGTFDENNQMLKHGRVRMNVEPNPFEDGDSFSQKLVLEDGNIIIKAKKGGHEITMNLWVDVFHPVVHIETESTIPVEVTASYESWRTEDIVVPKGMRHASFSLTNYPGEVKTYKDEIKANNNQVMWFHCNREDRLLYDFCVKQQGLEGVKDQIVNTQKGRTFGGILKGEGMVDAGTSNGKYVSTNFKAWHLKTSEKTTSNTVQLYLHTDICDSADEWKKEVQNLVEKTSKNTADAKRKTKEWWHKYWERSYIGINTEKADTGDAAWQVGRNYQLFRYMLGCNAYGDYPSKFNGSLFTVDPVFVTEKEFDWTPDFRQWGGGSFTAQNQRLVYWPMLKSGDFDMMPPQFNYYERILSSAEARTKVYWGHEGACFTEQLENFGLPFAGGWGFESGARKRQPETEFGVQTNKYVNHHYVNQLEFSLMILDYYQFSGENINKYLPFIKSSLKFFDEHYQYRQKQRTGETLDKEGKLVFYPSTAAEMYKIAKNPVDVISALKAILPRMIMLPDELVATDEKKYYQSFLERVPEITFDEKEGHKVIKPAESWEYVANQEVPELYTVYPYSIYGINKPDLDVAINTYWHGESKEKRKFEVCWSQVGIFAARMGLTEEAERLVKIKLADAPRRFPAFWGPGPDWVPDVDHGGSGMVNLQEMLMQTDGKEILLFPSWPKDWDVHFKMHAPNNTVVEAELKGGKLVRLNVTPKNREKDIQVLIK
ncbi:DUF5703 domain-containing protein [Flavivirga amylovorans]